MVEQTIKKIAFPYMMTCYLRIDFPDMKNVTHLSTCAVTVLFPVWVVRYRHVYRIGIDWICCHLDSGPKALC